MVDADEETALLSEEIGNGVGGGSGHSLSSKCVAMEDHARRSAMYASPMKYQSVTSFFAKILSRSTPVLQMAMGPYQDNGFDFPAGQVENELDEQSHSG